MDSQQRAHSLHTANLLANVQQDLQVLFTCIAESIFLVETNGTILVSNEVGAMWLSRKAEALAGENLFQLLTPLGIPIREWIYVAISKKTIYEIDTYFKDRFLHFRLLPVSEGKKIIRLIIVVQDITDQKRAEEQVLGYTEQIERKVLERTKELETANIKLSKDKRRSELLVKLSRRLMEESRNYRTLLEYITSEISDLIGDACLIALFSQDLSHIEVLAITDRDSASLPRQRNQLLKRAISIETNPIASKVLQGERYSVVGITYEKGAKILPPEFTAQLGENGLVALEVFPLHIGDITLGMLALSRETGSPYSPDEISFIESLISSVSFAIHNAQLFDQLTESQAQLRGLSQQLVQFQEKQFSHLAEELHDSIGQDMTAININLNILRNLMPKDVPEVLFKRLEDTENLVVESIKNLRSAMSELCPPMLDMYGLTASLYWYCEKFQRRTEIQVNINDNYMKNMRLPAEIEIAMFRIVQEALNNVAKHAKASKIDIELFEEGGKMMLVITDDGQGFNLESLKDRKLQHWGVPLMRERARAINGEFLLRSVPGQGTQIVVRVRRDR